MNIRTKICGLTTQEAVIAAQENGAEFVGFIFYPPSPRHLSPVAANRVAQVATAKKVAVVVDPDNALLDAIVGELVPDYIQLHGTESDQRAEEIKARYNVPLIRSRHPEKPVENELYDFLLIDAPKGKLPGGNGISFDWDALTPPKQDWFLSGGLNAANIEEAVQTTGARLIDVSSGVESSPGVKDIEKIKQFLEVIRQLR